MDKYTDGCLASVCCTDSDTAPFEYMSGNRTDAAPV